MHLNLVKNTDDHERDEQTDANLAGNSEDNRVRELKALVSIVDFAIYSAESAGSHEALAYLHNVADIVKADLAGARA